VIRPQTNFLPHFFSRSAQGFMFTRLRISASSSKRTLHLPSPHRCPRRTLFQSFVARKEELLEAGEEEEDFAEALLEGLDQPEDAYGERALSYEEWLVGPGLKYRNAAPRNWLDSDTVRSVSLYSRYSSVLTPC